MKVLSIQQPWASMIALGIKEVENRSWATKYRGKVLIHASSKKVTNSFYNSLPIEWALELENLVSIGALPELNTLPTSAIVGVAELADDVTESTISLWDARDESIHKFVMKNAQVFDEPITGVNGKLNLWEYPIEESELPAAHTAEYKYYAVEGTELIVPKTKAGYEELLENFKNFRFCSIWATPLTLNTIATVDEDDFYQAPDVKTIRFVVDDGSVHRYNLAKPIELNVVQDEDGTIIKGPSIFGGDAEQDVFDIFIGDEITE